MDIHKNARLSFRVERFWLGMVIEQRLTLSAAARFSRQRQDRGQVGSALSQRVGRVF